MLAVSHRTEWCCSGKFCCTLLRRVSHMVQNLASRCCALAATLRSLWFRKAVQHVSLAQSRLVPIVMVLPRAHRSDSPPVSMHALLLPLVTWEATSLAQLLLQIPYVAIVSAVSRATEGASTAVSWLSICACLAGDWLAIVLITRLWARKGWKVRLTLLRKVLNDEAEKAAAGQRDAQHVAAACTQLHAMWQLVQQAPCNADTADQSAQLRGRLAAQLVQLDCRKQRQRLAQVLVHLAALWRGAYAVRERAGAQLLLVQQLQSKRAQQRMLHGIVCSDGAKKPDWVLRSHVCSMIVRECMRLEHMRPAAAFARLAAGGAKRGLIPCDWHAADCVALALAACTCPQAGSNNRKHALQCAHQFAQRCQEDEAASSDLLMFARTLVLNAYRDAGQGEEAALAALQVAALATSAQASRALINANGALALHASSCGNVQAQLQFSKAAAEAWADMPAAAGAAANSCELMYSQLQLHACAVVALAHVGPHLEALAQAGKGLQLAEAQPDTSPAHATDHAVDRVRCALVHAQMSEALDDLETAQASAQVAVVAATPALRCNDADARVPWAHAVCLLFELQCSCVSETDFQLAMQRLERHDEMPRTGCHAAPSSLHKAVEAQQVARVQLLQGELSGSVGHAQQALVQLRQGGFIGCSSVIWEADVHAVLAQGLVSLGRRAEALHHAGIALEQLAVQGRRRSRVAKQVQHAIARAVGRAGNASQ